MRKNQANDAFELIHDIAVKAKSLCQEPVPEIIGTALEEIIALARYKGQAGNPIAADRRKLFGLPET